MAVFVRHKPTTRLAAEVSFRIIATEPELCDHGLMIRSGNIFFVVARGVEAGGLRKLPWFLELFQKCF